MTTTIPQPAATPDDGECPQWCTGQHGAPLLSGEAPGYRHLSAECPPWCAGHPHYDLDLDQHASGYAYVDLSLVPRVEYVIGPHGPDQLAVSVWDLHDQDGVHVGLMHAADDSWLPSMTPDEAQALGVALIAKAGEARQGIPAADVVRLPAEGCPPWCTNGPHGDLDQVHVSSSCAVPVTEHELCSYERARKAGHTADRCGEDLCAELVNGDDGCPVVEVYHGDDCCPHMTLDAAEAFAAGILALTASARGAAQQQEQGGAQ